MKTVQKGNKQLRVTDDRLEEMLKSGYEEVDEKTGKPVKPSTKDLDGSESLLKAANKTLKKENSELKKENDELKAQVKDLTARLNAQGGSSET